MQSDKLDLCYVQATVGNRNIIHCLLPKGHAEPHRFIDACPYCAVKFDPKPIADSEAERLRRCPRKAKITGGGKRADKFAPCALPLGHEGECIRE